jgi:outer membrane protein assembly factor BamB
MDDGMLYALNSDTGTVRARVSVGNVTRFATPTLSQGMVYVGTVDGVVAVKIL